MGETEVDKQLEGKLFQLLEDEARVRLGQLVLLRRRSRATGITLLHAALNAGLVEAQLARRLAAAAGLPGPTASPHDALGDALEVESVDLEPVTAEKLSPAAPVPGRPLPILRPPPLPPSAGGRRLEPRTPTPPTPSRPGGGRRTLDLLPSQARQTIEEISPEDETGPFDAIDDGFDEEASPPISVRAGVRRTERDPHAEAVDTSWRDTEPPSMAGSPDESVDLSLPTIADAANRYALGAELGRGGMGQVLEADDLTLERPVALKLLFDQDDPALCARFVDEARVTGQLQHPSVPPVYELGRLGDGRLFFAMKRIEGRTLRDIIEDLRDGVPETVKAFGRVRLLTIFARICRTIAYAHSRGVMHRDLKPDNMMLGEFGEVTVMDWGLAKPFEAPERPSGAVRRVTRGRFSTQAGDVTGTPHYMAPEQAVGDVEALGSHTDVYSLGAVLYEILTHRPPFRGKNFRQILAQVLTRPPLPPSKRAPENAVPRRLEEICMRCLAKHPDERFQSAADVVEALDQYMASRIGPARPPSASGWWPRAAATPSAIAPRRRHQKLRTRAALHRARTWPPAPGCPAPQALGAGRPGRRRRAGRRPRPLGGPRRPPRRPRRRRRARPDPHGPHRELYYGAFITAEHADDRLGMALYENLVKAFDTDGQFTALLKGDGQLEIGRLPDGLKATLFTLQEVDRIVRPTRPQGCARPSASIHPHGQLPHRLSGPGLSPTPVPVYVSRRERVRLRLRLPRSRGRRRLRPCGGRARARRRRRHGPARTAGRSR
ncbi:MAG: serine/threonine-protein kinase [bacterium]